MAKKKKTKTKTNRQIIVHKTQHIKLKTKQRELHHMQFKYFFRISIVHGLKA